MSISTRGSAARALCAVSLFALFVPGSASATAGDTIDEHVDYIEDHQCLPLTPPAAGTFVGTPSCPGVRPGGIVTSSVGVCTLNFLFRGSNSRNYMGTAGHCILPAPMIGDPPPAETVWASGAGPVARDADGNVIGRFRYAVLNQTKDFSLIELDPSVTPSATVCHFGGPTGINATSLAPELAQYYGNGDIVGEVVPARTALATSLRNSDMIFAWGVVVPGDSGAPAIDSEGLALGVVVSSGVHFGTVAQTGGGHAGTIGITRLTPQVSRAQTMLGITLTLQTGVY